MVQAHSTPAAEAMAEHIVSSVTSAVTGEVARELLSRLMGKLDRHGAAAAAAADKKLRRLELLLIKIHSAVEASEKHSIENAWLVTWRDKLREAAAEGDEVLASFRQQREVDPAAADQATQQQKQQQEHPSSSSSSASAAATTSAATRNAPSGMAQKNIRSATASDEDMVERLNSAVERLEELSPEIGTFVKLLKLEILKPEQTSSTGNRRKSEVLTPGPDQQTSTRTKKRIRFTRMVWRSIGTQTGYRTNNRSSRSSFALPIDAVLAEIEAGMMGALPNHRRRNLLDRLGKAFYTILSSVELAKECNMTAHVWLAHWASIFREAKDQVGAVIAAINAAHRSTTGAGEEVVEEEEVAVVGCDDYREEKEDDSELGRFVCSLESLAGEADYFRDLACLCPSYY